MHYSLSPTLLNKPIKIALIGAGGSGSQIATELFQMDSLLRQLSNQAVYIDLTLFDGDEVSIFNVGRQCFYMGDVGQNKADVLINRFNSFGGTEWKSQPKYFEPSPQLINDYHLIITAVDKAEFRVKLGQHFAEHEQRSEMLWLDVGNGKHDGQVVCGHATPNVHSPVRLPNVYDLYGSMLEQVDDNKEDQPSCSTEMALQKQDFGVNRGVAAQATQLIWQLLRYTKIEHHGAIVDVLGASVQPMKIDPQVWAVYGYEVKQ
ncbi:thiazole biosynthesis adenylyltransferase ThiF [Shewanella colwelliana]|uniref:Thiazole biosynthesis adenylyltransferase ThiF n=1 Tax=Shewanella colwelliana TaxID=23 RepID=A0ABQ4P0H9_SHECO|nr:PRTRC system ThiF family protein [Shewanella colwelliana]GIU41008.1 thiazole biosynthesis adenylyltransferase ThiF [Shewanella colwelliana]